MAPICIGYSRRMIRDVIARGFVLPILYAFTAASSVVIGWTAFINLPGNDAPWQVGILLAIPVFWLTVAMTSECYKGREQKMPVQHHGNEFQFIVSSDGRIGLNLGLDPQEWRKICQRLLDNNMRFTAAVVIRKDFGRKRFEALRSDMMEKGLLRWVNPHAPNQGTRLTRAGYEFISKYARSR